MRWPALILMGFGKYIWIPLPLFLIWPLLIPVVILAWLAPVFSHGSKPREWFTALRCVVALFAAVTGLRVHVVPEDGPQIRIVIV